MPWQDHCWISRNVLINVGKTTVYINGDMQIKQNIHKRCYFYSRSNGPNPVYGSPRGLSDLCECDSIIAIVMHWGGNLFCVSLIGGFVPYRPTCAYSIVFYQAAAMQARYSHELDLGAAKSSVFGSARNFFGSLSRLEPKITAQQQSCTQR